MKLGKIYNYYNIEESKKLVGKKVLVSNFLYKLENAECPTTTLYEVSERHEGLPFLVEFASGEREQYQFIREIEEEDELELMTNRQLSEWLARGNGHMAFANEKGQINPLEFIFTYYDICEKEGDKFVSQNICIRPWGSHEWIVPTVEIYERDCK